MLTSLVDMNFIVLNFCWPGGVLSPGTDTAVSSLPASRLSPPLSHTLVTLITCRRQHMFRCAIAGLPSSPTLLLTLSISAPQTCLNSLTLGLLGHYGCYSMASSLFSAPLFPLCPQNFYSSFMNNRKSHLL